MQIDFNPELFNPLYWHLKEAFDNEKLRYIWSYGGSSASKTYTAVQATVVEMLEGANNNSLILRKYAVDIKDSIYSDFKTLIREWGLTDFFKIQQNYIECVTGSYIRFRGLDDSEKIKGMSNFKRVLMEEVSQFDEADFKQIRKRLRGRKGQQILCLFNPISEEHWIKMNVFDKEIFIDIDSNITSKQINDKGNTLVMKVTYLDNYWIVGKWDEAGNLIGGFVDQHVIDDFEKDKNDDFNFYNIYALGNWGKLRTGGEFWKEFKTAIHVRECLWNKELPIHLSWDENVNPYLTCLVWQIEGKTMRQIDEICLPDPLNRVRHVCEEFERRYPQDKTQGLFIYGDRTSLKEDTKKEKGENFFTDIIKFLRSYQPKLRLQSVNPSVVKSGGFINEIYARNEGEISIYIDPKCKKSIFDYSYALEDSDGTIKKSKKTNPVTKVTYEEFAHASDAKRYIVTMAFAREYQNYLSSGRVAKISSAKNKQSKHGY